MYVKFLLFLTFFAISATGGTDTNDIPEIISHEVGNVRHTKRVSSRLSHIIKEIGQIKDKKLAADIFCQTCDLVITQVIEYRTQGASKESATTFLYKLCRLFTGWGDVACKGYIQLELDTILYIIDNKKDLTAARICGIYFQNKGCIDWEADKWVIPLPPKNKTCKAHQHRHHHHHHRKIPRADANNNPIKILHLTDFHYDPLYEVGSNAACNLPLCCQKPNGRAPKPEQAAGEWGDYHVCDMPWHSITNLTDYVSKDQYDFVYYTGDIISHRSWATDKDGNTQSIKDIYKLLKTTFKDTPVFPVLGNHEPHPTDFWSVKNVTDSVSTQWVFDLVADEWTKWSWMPSATDKTIRTGGFYTLSLNTKFKKLRIIGLNSNVCFNSNLWLLYKDNDPYDQLKWLVDVLTQAEKDGETVHILSHIPPGEVLCARQWSNQFHAIVNRFASTIAAQFNGHTHLDELRLFRDGSDPKKVINIAFNAGSFTTFVGLNPNYRTYDVDPTNYRVLDYDHFTYNITKANLNATEPPAWYKLYSFKEAYGLKNTTNEDLSNLLGRMEKNKTLVHQYWRYQGRESRPYLGAGCGDLCLKKALCTITAVETNQALECGQLTTKKH